MPANRQSASGAYARADSAHQKIDDHEKLCFERYGNINTTLNQLKIAADRQSALLWGIVLSVGGAAVFIIISIMLHAQGLQ